MPTVLVADDCASTRLSVRLLLEGRHPELSIREAIDGLDAIQQAEKLKPDLILLDLNMPRLNGAEAASALKGVMPDTPIILFTMYNDMFGDSLWSALGVESLSKSDGVSKLLERVDALFSPNTASPNGVILLPEHNRPDVLNSCLASSTLQFRVSRCPVQSVSVNSAKTITASQSERFQTKN
jgi:CheY-like chemotaxis protein